jgi:hypothetical protein
MIRENDHSSYSQTRSPTEGPAESARPAPGGRAGGSPGTTKESWWLTIANIAREVASVYMRGRHTGCRLVHQAQLAFPASTQGRRHSRGELLEAMTVLEMMYSIQNHAQTMSRTMHWLIQLVSLVTSVQDRHLTNSESSKSSASIMREPRSESRDRPRRAR